MKFKSKPVVIEAIQFTGSSSVDYMVDQWGIKFQRAMSGHQEEGFLFIDTLEGTHKANSGDWIIKGTIGEFYPCKPEVFEVKYEPA